MDNREKEREKSLDDIDGAPQLVLPPHSAAGLFVYLLYIMYRETVHFPPVDSLKLISFPCNNALTHTWWIGPRHCQSVDTLRPCPRCLLSKVTHMEGESPTRGWCCYYCVEREGLTRPCRTWCLGRFAIFYALDNSRQTELRAASEVCSA